VREKDEKGREYEEWIYGAPPQDVVFVRFIGDEVVQVKIAKVGGEMIVKTQKEVDVKDGVPTLASLKSSDTPQDVKAAPEDQQQPVHRPTLKRPDEQPDPALQPAANPGTPPPAQDEQQWGTHGKPPDNPPAPPQDQPKQPPL
jgi:spore germination cell wall hydrolase CwlJ-like protein